MQTIFQAFFWLGVSGGASTIIEMGESLRWRPCSAPLRRTAAAAPLPPRSAPLRRAAAAASNGLAQTCIQGSKRQIVHMYVSPETVAWH